MKANLLIVDDDNDLRELLVEALIKENYLVSGAKDGVEALLLCDQEKFDLVLTDVHMPRMDGPVMLKSLSEKHRSLPVLMFVSGFSDLSIEDAYDLGAVAVLSKPFDLAVLTELIAGILTNIKEPWISRAARYETSTEIKLKFPELKKAMTSQLFNIGKGGAFIQSDELPFIGSTVFFEMDFDDLRLSGIGIIRWARQKPHGAYPVGYGIEFLFLDEPGRSQLRTILNKLSRKEFIPKR